MPNSQWTSSQENGEVLVRAPYSGYLASYSIPAPGLTVEAFLKQAEGHPRFYWQKGGDETIYAGFGTAVQLMAWGESRFVEIQRQAATLFESGLVLGPQDPPVLPRLFGGFAFRDDFAPDNAWAAFYPAHFVLPHFQFVQVGADSWLTINALIAESDDRESARQQLREAVRARYQFLHQAAPAVRHPKALDELELRYPMTYSDWAEQVEGAVRAMQSSMLKKVVLARVCEIKSRTRIDVGQALTYLNRTFSDCTRFLFEPRPFHAFLGATPELLVKVSGRQLFTMSLAGSVARGETADSDDSLARQLLSSTKDRHEHQLVVDAIRRRLEPLTTELLVPDAPKIFQLSYIQHLCTPISGWLRQDRGVLPLVELLHPTPALGGSPRDLALQFINTAEPVPRGWYAGPVGWFDNHLDGEFVVAIRSAVVQDRRVWAYSGAGIVPESSPEIEWEETDLKFQPMLRAIGVDLAENHNWHRSVRGAENEQQPY